MPPLKIPYLHLYIVTADNWLGRIDQGPLRGSLIEGIAGLDIGVPIAYIDICFSPTDSTTDKPWFRVDGLLSVKDANGRMLNILADIIMARLVGHCYTVDIQPPIMGRCTISSVQDGLTGHADVGTQT